MILYHPVMQGILALGAIATAVAAIALVIRWLFVPPLLNYLKENLEPNQGHSLYDHVMDINKKLDEHLDHHRTIGDHRDGC